MTQTASTFIESSQTSFDHAPLPDGWRRVRLGDVCGILNGYAFDGVNFSRTEGTPLIRIRDLKTNAPEERYKGSFNPQYLMKQGALLVGMDGEFRCYQWRGQPALLNQRVCQLLPEKEFLDENFLLLTLNDYLNGIEQNTAFTTVKHISSKQILAIQLALPPLPEQKRIAAILNKQMRAVERARAAVEAQLEAAKDLPAAFMRAIFDSLEARQWIVKRLEEVCRDISDGTHFTPTYVQRGIPFLSVKDIKETGISFSSCRYITEEQHRDLCRRCKPERGDVLYTKVGTTGIAKAIDVDREFSIFVSVALLKLKSDVLPEYVEKVLNSPLGKAQAADLTQGMANRNLVIRDIRRIEIPVPSIEMQKHIIRVLGEQHTTSEQTRERLQDQLNAINNLPAALLRQAFTGKL